MLELKDIYQIFDKQFENILAMIDQYRFQNCANISVDLIRISTLSDYKDGILISEVLESVFGQIHPLFQEYEISKDEKDSIIVKLCDQISLLSKSYRKDNKEQTYEILKELRSMTTFLQFKCWNIFKRKHSEPKRFLKKEVI